MEMVHSKIKLGLCCSNQKSGLCISTGVRQLRVPLTYRTGNWVVPPIISCIFSIYHLGEKNNAAGM